MFSTRRPASISIYRLRLIDLLIYRLSQSQTIGIKDLIQWSLSLNNIFDPNSFLFLLFMFDTVSFVDDCTDSTSNTTTLTKPTGYLALFPRTLPVVLDDGTLQPSRTCPWLIDTEPGRRINITWQVVPVTSVPGVLSSSASAGLTRQIHQHHISSTRIDDQLRRSQLGRYLPKFFHLCWVPF